MRSESWPPEGPRSMFSWAPELRSAEPKGWTHGGAESSSPWLNHDDRLIACDCEQSFGVSRCANDQSAGRPPCTFRAAHDDVILNITGPS